MLKFAFFAILFQTTGIKTVLIHRHASILSAYGLAYADAVQEAQEPVGKVYSKGNGINNFKSHLDGDKVSEIIDKFLGMISVFAYF